MSSVSPSSEAGVTVQSRGHAIKVADGNLQFHQYSLADPVPLGRQILEAADARPIEDYSLFALLPGGDFEDVRLNETFDLRARGVERFVMFSTDRLYKFAIDQHQMEWGKPVISGKILSKLANA